MSYPVFINILHVLFKNYLYKMEWAFEKKIFIC